MRHPYKITTTDLDNLFLIRNPGGIKIQSRASSGADIEGSVCSIVGIDKKGEDTFVSFSSAQDLDPQKIGSAMEGALKKLNKHAQEKKLKGGSTASIVAITPDLKATCTNIGDSYNIAFIWHAETGQVSAYQLNKLHCPGQERERLQKEGRNIFTSVSSIRPNDESEYSVLSYSTEHTQEAISAAVDSIHQQGNAANIIHRIATSPKTFFSLSRAINDEGIDAIPETIITDLSNKLLSINDRVFIFSSTDGLFDTSFHNLDNYCKIVKYAITHNQARDLADILCNFATKGVSGYNVFSVDDKTAVFTEIPTSEIKQTYFQGVFDGHNGKDTSVFLSNDFAWSVADELGAPVKISSFFNRFNHNISLNALQNLWPQQSTNNYWSSSSLSSGDNSDSHSNYSAIIKFSAAIILTGLTILVIRESLMNPNSRFSNI